MSTTSLKLPDELKQRAVKAAQGQGISPHAFMVRAIDLAASSAERRASFTAEAQTARKETLRTGDGYDSDEVHAYLKDRIAGKKSVKPRIKPWRS